MIKMKRLRYERYLEGSSVKRIKREKERRGMEVRGEKSVDVREGEQMCVCAMWYKEGQWCGSGIIWRGRCWNILSWITALYTGETDRRTTDSRAGGGKRETGSKRDAGTDERRETRNQSSNSFFSPAEPYLEERKSSAQHFLQM